MYKAVIFDFGGVMHSSKETSGRQDILGALKGPHGFSEEELLVFYKESLTPLVVGEISELQFWEEICSKVGIAIPPDWSELWVKQLKLHAEIYDDMFDLVVRLQQAGIKTYVLSNTIESHVKFLREKNLYSPFDKVFLSNEIHLEKPHKEAYSYVIDEIKVAPADLVFVDDKEENLAPAKELGMKTVHAKSPRQVIAEIEQLIPSCRR